MNRSQCQRAANSRRVRLIVGRSVRAISLHQPWADLIALGHKTYETRNWSTKYRGPILICSARKYDKIAKLITSKYQHPGPHPDSLYPSPLFGLNYEPRLGMALVLADLVDCRQMVTADKVKSGFFKSWSTAGKYVWTLENITPIEPVDIIGRQGLFDPAKQGIQMENIKPLQMRLFDA